jgi:deoxyribose-phosphate aldolase
MEISRLRSDLNMSISVDGLKKLIRDATSEGKPVEEHIEHSCKCPGCYCGIVKKMNSESEVACKTCGLPLGSKDFAKKIDQCPNCGAHEAEEISSEDRENWRQKMGHGGF